MALVLSFIIQNNYGGYITEFNGLDQRTAWGAPVRWSKYITDIELKKHSNVCAIQWCDIQIPLYRMSIVMFINR